ncbi:MAG TPA: hypothetical protein VGC79_37040 [Polyangiaceae bacterium]
MSLPRSSLLALAAPLAALLLGCQTTDEHPPFAAACQKNCPLLPGVIGGGSSAAGGSGSNPDSDAGTGTLQGQVFQLTDATFIPGSLYKQPATVTADGANGSPVTATWTGVDPFDPFVLDGVARVAINWLGVEPEQIGGDALPTYQALQTYQIATANLALVSATVLDGVFNAVSTLRSPDSGQVVVFFRSAGTNTPLSGLHVTMARAQEGIYRSATGWLLDDGTAVTDASGLVVFGNVDPAAAGSAQLITVTRAATTTMGAVAAGQFPVKVVQGAVSIASVGVQL